MENQKEKVEKKDYIKPEVVRVELVAEEAVLGCGKDTGTPCGGPALT